MHKLSPKSRSHIKILGAKKKVTWSKFHAQHPQTSGATVQTLQLHAELDFATPFPFTMNGNYNPLRNHMLVNRKGLHLSLCKLWWHGREKTYSSTHFYLGTRRKCSDSSSSRFNCWESTSQYQICRMVGMPQSQSQRFTQKKTILPVLGIKPTVGSRLSSPSHK